MDKYKFNLKSYLQQLKNYIRLIDVIHILEQVFEA